MCTVSVCDIQVMLVQVGLLQEPKLNVNGSSGHKKEKTRENISATLPRNDLLSHYIGGHRSQWK